MKQDLFTVTAPLTSPREYLSVSQLNNRARLLLEDVLAEVWVEGEISNLARPASGHLYFSLKDSKAQVRCALFRGHALRLRGELRNGLLVRVHGRVSLFEGRGDFQLLVDALEPGGDGALRLAFEALKTRLSEEGLFAAERKRALPAHPQRIGIISSPGGAVFRDIISVMRRRAPQLSLTLIPTAVQGEQAAAQIVAAVQLAARGSFDALILARGGGSLEDLWCFNEESVVRAVAACPLPIISAIGHETDITLCDFAADVRAPTPSAAAELLAPDNSERLLRVNALARRLQVRLHEQLARQQLRLDSITHRLRHPGERLQQQAQRLDELDIRLKHALATQTQRRQAQWIHWQSRLGAQHPERRCALLHQRLTELARRLEHGHTLILAHCRQQMNALAQQLHLVSPLATLARGYSILQDERGQVLRRARDTAPGQTVQARLAQGQLTLRVESCA